MNAILNKHSLLNEKVSRPIGGNFFCTARYFGSPQRASNIALRVRWTVYGRISDRISGDHRTGRQTGRQTGRRLA